MICYSIHTEHSSEFSINNDSIETEFVHVESNETLSTSKLSNNKKKNQKGEKNTTLQENEGDIKQLINDNKYVENNLIFGDQMIDKDGSITRFFLQNVNVLESISHGHAMESMCDSMPHHLIDSAYLCETNTHWEHNSGLKNLNNIIIKFVKKKDNNI